MPHICDLGGKRPLHWIHVNLQYCSQVWSREKQVPFRGSEELIRSILMILGYTRLLYNPVTTSISLQNYRINTSFNNSSKSLNFYRRIKQTKKKKPKQPSSVPTTADFRKVAIYGNLISLLRTVTSWHCRCAFSEII